ncbi:L,D-transpeptidase family protein [Labrys sp. LIt4]|uniref:L,D-transpeptidase family protein n=1 Tax=Labrys sp. LIt4 TaxID=2821355 RepID=UPI001ADF5708|nr:L,D-transpeptidase family protein [Labrys sp. LIt4]MBP0581787.1 L,D-transpeptidase family protein [Labrys sp. LIt4]
MSAILLPAYAQDNGTPASPVPVAPPVPGLSAGEKQSAFAPATPQTAPAAASPQERVSVQHVKPDNAPASTATLAPAPVGPVPVPAPVEMAPKPAETAVAPDTPSSISATAPKDEAARAGTQSVAAASPAGQPAPAAVPTPKIPAAVPSETPAPKVEPKAEPKTEPMPPAEASTPAPSVAPATVTMNLSARLADYVAKRGADAQAISDFYALRGLTPLWIDNGALTPAAKALVDRMSRAAEDGLDAAAFRVPGIDSLSGASADVQADTEIALSAAILTYVRQASSGRVDTRQISRDIAKAPNMPDPVAALASVAIASNPVAVLDGYNPSSPQYLALKQKLADVRAANAAAAEASLPVVPAGPTLKVGMTDTRVAVLRTRLGLTASDADSDVYDEALQAAVRDFQAARNLKASGTLGPATVVALNAALRQPRVNVESEIIANMERWRWLPHDMGLTNVFVNVPEYKVWFTKDGVLSYEARVVVGKANTPTPIFSDMMSFVVVNPSWNVPQSIIKKEYMPKLAQDPGYLERRGYEVSYVGGQMQVRQPPGERNALGFIKFMFPNNFSVYLHDTPQRNLFSRDERAFSHGCVRVDNPYKFAELVMGNGWTEDSVRGLQGGDEQRIDLERKIPVHIAYFTAYVDGDGELQRLNDIYGYDRKVISALGLPG